MPDIGELHRAGDVAGLRADHRGEIRLDQEDEVVEVEIGSDHHDEGGHRDRGDDGAEQPRLGSGSAPASPPARSRSPPAPGSAPSATARRSRRCRRATRRRPSPARNREGSAAPRPRSGRGRRRSPASAAPRGRARRRRSSRRPAGLPCAGVEAATDITAPRSAAAAAGAACRRTASRAWRRRRR